MRLSLYVHVPFCRSRCAYCAFYSGEPLAELAAYPAHLAAEMALRARTPGPLYTVYFGGGTPSLLGPPGIAAVLEAAERTWGIAPGAEITVEANPGADPDLPGLRAAGVNRLSLGVQALDDALLARLGRPHRAADARANLAGAVAAGFERISADLLYGLPGLAPGALVGWASELVARGAGHLSAYSLELHEGTALAADRAAGAFALPDGEEEGAQAAALGEALAALGLSAYEVSNFARPEERCRHNLAYWDGLPYLGLGPGAHGYEPGGGRWGCRWWNDPGLAPYAQALGRQTLPPGGSEELTRDEALLERLFLGLRRPAPLDFGALERAFGLPPGAFTPALTVLRRDGLLADLPGGSAPTPAGLRRADGLALWLRDQAVSRP